MNLKRQIKRLARRVSLDVPAPSERRFADLGDAARDRGDWAAAADHYARHLRANPDDFAIWVQSGHANKEAGSLDRAEQSYGQALKLNPQDADLLISCGHLKKLRNDFTAAAQFYAQAAEIEQGGHGLVELTSGAFSDHLTGELAHVRDTVTQSRLQRRLDGLTLIASDGVSLVGEDKLALTSGDPWLKLKVSADRDARLGELRISLTSDDHDRQPLQVVYLDYGWGFSEKYSFELPEAEDGEVVLHIAAPAMLDALRWDPDNKEGVVRFTGATYRDIEDIDLVLPTIRARIPSARSLDDAFAKLERRLKRQTFTPESAFAATRSAARLGVDGPTDYATWLHRWVTPDAKDYVRIAAMTDALTVRPKFSFVMPVYNPPPDLLVECLDSMLAQTYEDFEICIADDRSPDPEIRRILESYVQRDPRIKVTFRERNGHISAASNSALELATGDFVVLIDHDDLVPDYALFVVAHAINAKPKAQILFSDEDKITTSGERFEPYFKGDFDPFLMFAHNMVSHLGVYRRDLIESIGGFRLGLEGSQDYDLVLRALEKVERDAIVHIPHVLYHWRAIPGSTSISGDEKGYAIVAAQQAINGHFERTDAPFRSVKGAFPGVNAIKATRTDEALISIIIPTRDGLDDLRACIASIRAFDHANVEILVVDNGSEDEETLAYLKRIGADPDVRVLAYPQEFNFSSINNFAAAQARGDIICFLNNDTEVLAANWLDRARALFALPGVGVVGAKLLYPDQTIQHFGVIAGFGRHRVAGHAHHGLPQSSRGYAGKAVLLQQFSAVTAACLFIKADFFQEIGGFDPELRVAYNDIDLCLRARKAGRAVLCDPEILLIHKESKSRGSDKAGLKARRLDEEAAVMRERWAQALDNDPFYSPNHDLDHGDFRFAQPPRTPLPWRIGDERERTFTHAMVVPSASRLDSIWLRRNRGKRPTIKGPFDRSNVPAELGIAVWAVGASEAMIEKTLRSLNAQQRAAGQIFVLRDDAAASPSGDGSQIPTFDQRARVMADQIRQPWIMIVKAGDELEPEAISRFSDAFEPDIGMVYCDEMVSDPFGDTVSQFHAKPVFSRDTYLSRPYFERGVAIDRALMARVLQSSVADPLVSEADLILRVTEIVNHVAHIPAFLYRTASGESAASADHLGSIRRHLAVTAPTAQAVPGLAPGSFRIDYPDDGGRTLIVIPTKDGVELLRTCIDSLKRTAADADIVIIDHESVKPETLDYLSGLSDQVTIIPYAGKFNYAHMNNVAVSKMTGDYRYVVFMNNDVEAIESGWLERMRSLASRPDVGVVGATLLYANRTIQHAGVTIGIGGCAAHAHAGTPFEHRGVRQPGYGGSLVSTREYSAVTAACMMMRMDVFLGVGGFDEQLAVGFNDTDLCLRVGSLGYKIINDAHTVLYHHESATRSLTDDLKHPEDAIFFRHRWHMLLAKGDPFYNPLLSLSKDYELGDFTAMNNPVRVRPVSPELRPLSFGRPSPAPAPLRYHGNPSTYRNVAP